MKFLADLHIHSKFSRACAKNLDFENLYINAQLKGITVVATGDFTHPAWFSEIKEKLIEAEPGLFRLRKDLEKACDEKVPEKCRGPVRFILETEISNIYKKNDKVRKNHNLVFLPSLETAEKFNSKLDSIGNIKSDGRPILGLDAKHLLEIMLEISDNGFLIPAHIWTPWFSLLGSKSGFDSVYECFEDLTPHIFAVETGLSSDPAMNWQVEDLDDLTLVSNSDAHSPSKLGREANIFDTDLSYDAIKSAMKTGDNNKFLGTLEFYPQEGKYHLDGHRKCNLQLTPEESKAYNGICPACGRPITLGVLYRVNELATRKTGEKPSKANSFENIIPLVEILSEIHKVGVKSKRVQSNLSYVVDKLGPELTILTKLPIDIIKQNGFSMLAEAIKRMRENNVFIFSGYDGEYGKIKLFDEKQKESSLVQIPIFDVSKKEKSCKPTKTSNKKKKVENSLKDSNEAKNKKTSKITDISKITDNDKNENNCLNGLNDDQIKAVKHFGTPLMIIAGPGTGKTLTITRKIAYLINELKVLPENILAVTFTNKAAHEMQERLKQFLDPNSKDNKDKDKDRKIPSVFTFHSFCFSLLQEINEKNYKIIDEYDRKILITDAVNIVKSYIKEKSLNLPPKKYLNLIIKAKQNILSYDDDLLPIISGDKSKICELRLIYKMYQNLLDYQNLFDFEDLLFNIVKIFESDPKICAKYQNKFKYIFIDEYQNLNYAQYRLVKNLVSKNNEICVIGDPNQSIYGFRGSDVKYFKDFEKDYKDAKLISLNKNYRSTETILSASYQVIKNQDTNFMSQKISSGFHGLKTIGILDTENENKEAVTIGKIIEQMIGGIGFYSVDFGKIQTFDKNKDTLFHNDFEIERSFSDFAILTRTHEQQKKIASIFNKAGLPNQVVSKNNAYCQNGIIEIISYLKLVNGIASIIDLERVLNIDEFKTGKQTICKFKNYFYKDKINISEFLSNPANYIIKNLKVVSQKNLNKVFDLISITIKKIKNIPLKDQILYIYENTCSINKTINENSIAKDAFNKFFEIACQYKTNINDFFKNLTLSIDTDIYDEKAEKISLLTMHAAKGLEFPIVFIAGCEDNLIPYKKIKKDTMFCDIDEEKRLFYVAMTRAKESLFLTYSKTRLIHGKVINQNISPFVKDIEDDLKKHEKFVTNKKPIKKTKKKIYNQLDIFEWNNR